MTALQTVVELPEFLRCAKAIMTDDERGALVDYIAANPEAGVPLGGGLRKVRIPRGAAARAAATGRSTCSEARKCQSTSSPCSPRTRRTI